MSEKIITTITDNINKTVDTIIEPVKQRMANPIIGSFIITWLAFNWQPLLFFIFSSQTVECKIGYIKANFYGDQWSGWQNWCFYLLIPLFLSCLYIWASPRIINCIDKLNKNPLDKQERRKHIEKYLSNKRRIDHATQEGKITELRTQHRTLEKQTEVIKNLEQDKVLLLSENEKILQNLTDEKVKFRSEKEEDLLKHENEKNEIRTENNATIKLLENARDSLRTEKELLTKSMESAIFTIREEKELVASNMNAMIETLRAQKEELRESYENDKTLLRNELSELNITISTLTQDIISKDSSILALQEDSKILSSDSALYEGLYLEKIQEMNNKMEEYSEIKELLESRRNLSLGLLEDTLKFLDQEELSSLSQKIETYSHIDIHFQDELVKVLKLHIQDISKPLHNYLINVVLNNKYEDNGDIQYLISALLKVNSIEYFDDSIQFVISTTLSPDELGNITKIITQMNGVEHTDFSY